MPFFGNLEKIINYKLGFLAPQPVYIYPGDPAPLHLQPPRIYRDPQCDQSSVARAVVEPSQKSTHNCTFAYRCDREVASARCQDMCCCSKRKAKRDRRAIGIHSAYGEPATVAISPTHEALHPQRQPTEHEFGGSTREVKSFKAVDVKQQSTSGEKAVAEALTVDENTSPPPYSEVAHVAPSPRTPALPLDSQGRDHSHANNLKTDDSLPIARDSIDMASLPSNHPIHGMSRCRIKRLRRRGIDPVRQAELDDLARQSQAPFWSKWR